jgi:hypothetical protein
MSRRGLLGLAFAIVLLALLVRGWQGASRKGVWRDEANAFFVVRESATLDELFANLRVESTPPLQPLLEYALQRVAGTDPAWLRAVSVVFGTLTVLGIVALGWRAFHPSCGLLAGLLTATSPYFIRLSGEMRSYALFGLLAVVHAFAYLRYLERRRLGDACLWGASAALLAYAHYYAFPVVFCAAIGALVRGRARADLMLHGAAAAVFLALYAPWIPGFWHQLTSDLQPWYPPVTGTFGLHYVLKLPLGYLGGFLLGGSLLLGAVAVRARAGAPPDPLRLRFWGLFAISVAPAAVAWAAQVYAGAFEGRYLVATAVPLMPIACLAWSRMFLSEPVRLPVPGRKEPVVASGAMCRVAAWALLAGAVLVQHVDRARWLRPSSPARELASLVHRHARPDDIIWIFPAPYASSFNFYYRGPQQQFAFPFRGRVTRIDWPALRDREQDPAVIDAFLDELRSHLDARRRVWALFVERLPMDSGWAFAEGPSAGTASRLARAETHVHRRALRILYTRARVAGWWDRPHNDYHEGMTLVLFEPRVAATGAAD